MAVPQLPQLLVSRAEAEEKIRAQITRGLEITHSLEAALSGFGFAQSGALEKAGADHEKWAKFTLDLLRYLFADLPIGREFGSWKVSYSGAKSDWPRQLLKRMIEWIHSLESIIDRLPLFPLAEKPVQATAAPAPARPGLHMKVFISWSGPLSHRVALSLREWLPVVLSCINPWVSSEDILKGTRWGTQLASELEGTHSGIICLVPGNLTEPWLNFEAGALSKSVATGRIHPFLFGVDPRELPGPLAQFQATRFSKDDMRKLIRALNLEAAAEAALPTANVDNALDVCWPDLERRLTPLLADAQTDPIETAPGPREIERVLTEEELKILCRVANSKRVFPKALEESVGLHWQRIQHIMETLEGHGLLYVSHNAIHGPSWSLSKEGRAFLVKEDLL